MFFTSAMELKFSKINFSVVVLFAILLLPRWSEAEPIFTEQRKHCGKPSINDTGPGQTAVQRKHPWVVGVEAIEGGKSYTCSGAVFTPRLVLTSKFCAPVNPNARYVIHYGLGRHNPVTEVIWIKDTQFTVLEVLRPFRADFAICLAHALSAAGLNDTVWTASRADPRGLSAMNALEQEQWTLVDSSPGCSSMYKSPSDNSNCAEANDTGNSACLGYEGKPVMRWNGRQWYLIGVVTQVLYKDRCTIKGTRYRTFQWIHPSDSVKIGKIIDSNKPYYLPEPEEAEVAPRYACGKFKKLHLGPWKEVAPLLLPWVVAVRATLGTKTINCVGTIIAVYTVITAEDCYPKGFENATYTVVHNSIHISVGKELTVRRILRKSTDLKPSLVVLVLTHRSDINARICSSCAPFRHSGKQVVAASWAFTDVGGRLRDQLYYEEWTLPNDPNVCDGEPFDNKGPGNQTLICAIAQTDQHFVCRGDLGTPVMYWSQGNWCLLGVVTHVDVPEGQECVLRKTWKRIFQLTSTK